MNHYNSIVIGGGINSLTTSAILAKEEKYVLLLETRSKVGGMASTEEFAPGFRCNVAYDYCRWIDPRLLDQLNLQKYGLEMFSPNPLRIALDDKGQHIVFHSDPQKTATSISYHSNEDANKWPEFTKYITNLTQFLEPLYRMTPPSIRKLNIKDLFSMSSLLKPVLKHGRRGLVDTIRTLPMMMPELLDEWFQSELLRGSLAASGISNITQGPFSSATGLNFLHQHIYSKGKIHNIHFIKGGINHFATSIRKAAKDRDVDILHDSHVDSINCSDGRCSGVTTSDGRTYNGDKIISGLDPSHTYMKVNDATEMSPTFRMQLTNIKYRGSTARIHFALNKLPEIIGISAQTMNTIYTINPSIEYLERAYDDAKYGRISKNPYIEFSFPSIINPNFAPSGKHVLSATIQYVPYYLKNDNWNNGLKNKIINIVTYVLEKYIPGFTNMIEDTLIMTPRDLEASLGITEGDLNHGEMTLDQFFFMRPTISTAQYNTPIQNLFLCGPGTHPGGGLHGANAMNAMNEILKY